MLDDLRLLILIIGVVAVAFLVVDSIRRRAKKHAKTAQFEQTIIENTHNSTAKTSLDPLFDEVAVREGFTSNQSQAKTAPSKGTLSKVVEDVIIISVQARHKAGFSGRSLESALKSHCFYFGEKNIFHRHAQDNPNNPILYSIAQSTEPGSFDLSTLKHQRIPGIVVFMLLPAVEGEPNQIFNQMLKSARRLAANLNGELCDAEHRHLTSQTIEQLRDKINHIQPKSIAPEDTPAISEENG